MLGSWHLCTYICVQSELCFAKTSRDIKIGLLQQIYLELDNETQFPVKKFLSILL